MDERPSEAQAGGTSLDQDLYCLECGYNLRGLSGDPRRCPECGHENPLSELTLPADAISRALRQMETAPTICVGAAIVGFFMAIPLLVLCLVSDICSLACPAACVVFAVFLWSTSAKRFAQTCGAHPAWRSALFKYHLYGMGAGIPATAAIIATGLTFANGRSGVGPLVMIIDSAVVLALVAFASWARRDIKATVDPLQRDLAVRIAKQHLADQMRRR